MSELKPCPFCGSEPILIYFNGLTPSTVQHYQVAVSCDGDTCNCSPRTAYETSEESAIKAWNRRANDE